MILYIIYNLQTEKLYGVKDTLLIYALAGVLTNVITFATGTSPIALGASGSAYGLLGAMGAYFYVNRKALGRTSVEGTEYVAAVFLL